MNSEKKSVSLKQNCKTNFNEISKIRAKEIKIEAVNWPDYVFTAAHKKLLLTELDTYIYHRA